MTFDPEERGLFVSLVMVLFKGGMVLQFRVPDGSGGTLALSISLIHAIGV